MKGVEDRSIKDGTHESALKMSWGTIGWEKENEYIWKTGW